MNLAVSCVIDFTGIHDTVFTALVKQTINSGVAWVGYADAAFCPVEA